MRNFIKSLLDFDSSLDRVFIILWGGMMAAYYASTVNGTENYLLGIAVFFCGGELGVSGDFLFPTFLAAGLSIFFVLVFILFGNFPTRIAKISPKGLSVPASAFLAAALCLFFALFFVPCTDAAAPGNGTGLSKFGNSLMPLVQKYFPIYSFVCSIFMGGFYYGCVVFIKAGKV